MVNLILVFLVNILRVMLIKKLTEIFLSVEDTHPKLLLCGYGVYYLVSSITYFFFQISIVYELLNLLCLMCLMMLYHDTWKKRLLSVLVVLSMDMGCSLAVFFLFRKLALFQQYAVQALLLLICVNTISSISLPNQAKEINTAGRHTVILIIIPAISLSILVMMLYNNIFGKMAAIVCMALLVVNLCVFYLYNALLENYIKLRENDIYKQQTVAYQNQLDVILESQSRIRALKHDMKNHILALQALAQNGQKAEMQDYLSSMQKFMVNPTEHVFTGNESIDSLLNYKLQKAQSQLKTVASKITIPEKLDLHSFDLNVVLGNLLDNAIEASAKTEEKILKLDLRCNKGILFLNIGNSCIGVANGRKHTMLTTKANQQDHGIGLANVRRIVEKYHGDMDIRCDHDFMEIEVMLYIQDL